MTKKIKSEETPQEKDGVERLVEDLKTKTPEELRRLGAIGVFIAEAGAEYSRQLYEQEKDNSSPSKTSKDKPEKS